MPTWGIWIHAFCINVSTLFTLQWSWYKVVVSMNQLCLHQWSERFLGITGWDPSVCKSNRLHVHILRFSFIKLGYSLYIPLKLSAIFLHSWTSTGYVSNSTRSFVTSCRFSLIRGLYLSSAFIFVPVLIYPKKLMARVFFFSFLLSRPLCLFAAALKCFADS